MVNKTVTKTDERLETEMGNFRSCNSKPKRETETEPLNKKKKLVLTGDSMVNGIFEKGLSVNHKAKILNFPGGTNERKIKEKSDDLIVLKLELMISLKM